MSHNRFVNRDPLAYIQAMPLDLTDDEREALTRHLRAHIQGDPYPFAPRLKPLKRILEKLDPQPVRAPLPEQKRYPIPSTVMKKGRRR
jgi:hypothetical protein